MKCVDLFSGVGGMSLGFQREGFDILGAFDSWEFACENYNKNFNHNCFNLDIDGQPARSIISLLSPDVIFGGPPCQDFSVCGNMNINGGKAVLSLTFCDIICDNKPLFFVMENVPAISKSPLMSILVSRFTNCGYGLSFNFLDASYCNVPQKRERLFVVGGIGCKNGFLDKYIDDLLSNERTSVYKFMGDEIDFDRYFLMPRSYMNRGVLSVNEPCLTIRGNGGGMPFFYNYHNSDATEGRLCEKLSAYHRMRIQSFPKDFVIEGKYNDQCQAIGNAVPPNMAGLIARALMNFINEGL
jgi:DNA (cytosine-5)-methyltransferase 1